MLTSDARKARAVPWNPAWMPRGMPRSSFARSIARTASPSETPGARLKETVTTGNCPWWLIASGARDASMRVKAERGTTAPDAPRT